MELPAAEALEEVCQHLPDVLSRAADHPFAGEVVVNHDWYPSARTFVYHTVSAVDGAGVDDLEAIATVFAQGNRLDHQPWYSAFIDGQLQDAALPFSSPVRWVGLGSARFDFGLRQPRFYNQLITLLQPDEHTRVVALRSVSGLDTPQGAIKAYTLSPTADIFQLDGDRITWHHIVTVLGPALLPPAADRLLMNTLRRLGLDKTERRTYLDEGRGFRNTPLSQWRELRETLD